MIIRLVNHSIGGNVTAKTSRLMNSIWISRFLLVGLVAFAFAGRAGAQGNTGTGGTITYLDASGLNPRSSPPYDDGYVVHKFTNSGSLTIPVAATNASLLVVGGGGGGGGGGNGGGGGGAGGLIYYGPESPRLGASYPILAGTNYTVIVGSGGAGGVDVVGTASSGGNGNNSSFGFSGGTLTALGGGGGGGNAGGSQPQAGKNGGSGGGGAYTNSSVMSPGSATQPGSSSGGYGNSGGTNGYCGGGGGAGSVGSAANGGTGLLYTISGSAQFYAGGGSGAGGTGGSGVGGSSNGSDPYGTPEQAGVANTGSGGAGTWASAVGGAGGSGIVIIKYPYEPPGLRVTVTAPADDQAFLVGSSITATVTVANGTPPYAVKLYTNSAVAWSTNGAITNTFNINLGSLPIGSYTQYARVTDSATPGAGTDTSATNTFMVVVPSSLQTWAAPAGTPSNTMFSVKVRKTGDTAWTDLFVYKAQVGLQGQTPMDSSLVLFDFAGSVDVQVTYNGGTVTSYDIRPLSYGITATQAGNTLTFRMEQGSVAPRKLVLRINDDWYTKVLHILTNPLEEGAPQLTDANVYAIDPGQPVPAELPAGKTVYYFKPGQHDLPRGLWLDVDLGAQYSIGRIQLDQGQHWSGVDVAHKFQVETRTNAADAFTTAYDGTSNTSTGNIERAFSSRNARYLRLWLLGATRPDQQASDSVIKEFRVFGTDGSTNLALGRATGGGLQTFANATDGNTATRYSGSWPAFETFYLSKSGYTMYVAGGAVVRGSVTADGLDNITVRGRGVLDCRQLTHTGEESAHAIMLIRGKRPVIEGVTVIDGVNWSVMVNWTVNPLIRNINIINNKVLGDGIHFGGTTGTRIDGVFIRAPDDQLVCYHYGTSYSNTVENSVVWADEVQTMLLGMGGEGDLHDFTFRNIDVVNSRGYPPDPAHFTGVMKLWANNGRRIYNILFHDIRIDPFQVPGDASVFQFRNDTRSFPGGVPGGVISNITVSNVTYGSTGEMSAKILADTNMIRDIRFVNYRRGGVYATNATMANVVITGPASNITFTIITNMPAADADGDGMPDAWEIQYLGGTNALPTADADGDGLNNLQEFIAGTNPNDPTSVLALTVPSASPAFQNQFIVRWQSASNKFYRLLATTNLALAFSNCAINLPATPPVNVYTDNTAQVGQKFYRVRLD